MPKISRTSKRTPRVSPSDAEPIDQWLVEIALAWQEAAETQPISEASGRPLSEADFFHLTPAIACKRAGRSLGTKALRELTGSVLATIVTARDHPQSKVLVNGSPQLLFAYAYINCLLGIDRISFSDADDIIDLVLIQEHDGGLSRMFQLAGTAAIRHCPTPPPTTPAAWVDEICVQWRSSADGVVMPKTSGSAATTMVPGSLAERALLCVFRARGSQVSWSLLRRRIGRQTKALADTEAELAATRGSHAPHRLQEFATRYLKWHQGFRLIPSEAVAPVLAHLETSWSSALAKAGLITTT
jgi:hypothetical protein